MAEMTTQHQVEIVTLPASEWRTYRDARLRALSEDPQAYSRTYAESAAPPDEMWQARLQSVADGSDWLFFARLDGEIVGMMGAYRLKDVEGTAVIWGVHVDNAQRGQGIGGELMARLLDELGKAGTERVMLTVNREQAAAVGLYKKFGFAVVSDGREQVEYVMERGLQEATFHPK
jgi:ribosomal protein S18 acetylase RimI-like enzyme